MSKKDWLAAESPEGACAGRSLVEIIEDALDAEYAQLLAETALPTAERMEEHVDFLKGRCSGLTTALAIIQQPYYPSEDAVKAALVRRFETQKEEESEDTSLEPV